MVENGSLIHIKLEQNEAIESRRNILASQIILLKILKKVNEYKTLRAREFELKLKLYKKIREVKTDLENLKKALPKLKIPKILNQKEDEEKPIRKTESYDLSIEGQLHEIQRKLDELQKR